MAIIVEAPNEDYSVKSQSNTKLFLAGGITGCTDWQSRIIKNLKHHDDLTIFNPRRKDFPMNDPAAAEQQIGWEFRHLREADIIAFWFSQGSLNPIALYELGMWGNSRLDTKQIIIGIHPLYKRKQDKSIFMLKTGFLLPPLSGQRISWKKGP